MMTIKKVESETTDELLYEVTLDNKCIGRINSLEGVERTVNAYANTRELLRDAVKQRNSSRWLVRANGLLH